LPDIDDGSPEKMVLLNLTRPGHACLGVLRRPITMARAQRQSVSEACLAASGVRMVATFVLTVSVSTDLVLTVEGAFAGRSALSGTTKLPKQRE